MRRDSGSSENGQFSGAPVSKTEYLGFTGTRAGNASKGNQTSCIYAYVNCMDTLIHRILNKNAFLGTDPAVKHLVLSDKPFRCVYAGAGEYDDYITDLLDQAKMQDTSFTFMINEHFGRRNNSSSQDAAGSDSSNRKFDAGKWVFEKVKIYTKELTGKIQEDGERDVEDYWVNALYKKYNFFCQEKQQSNDKSCAYSGKGHSDYMATKESTAYYMDLSSRVHGGCSNAFVEYPIHPDDDNEENEDENKEKIREAETKCKVSGGSWHKPNSLKMVDMSADIMSDLGADSKGICVLVDGEGKFINQNACRKYGAEAKWDDTSDGSLGSDSSLKGCLLNNATATSCKSIDQVYSNSGTGTLVQGTGKWIRRKEWAFVLNTAPPAITLNPGEEFGWAHGICMTATGIDGVSKSKFKAALKEQLISKMNVEGKEEDGLNDYIGQLLAPRESSKRHESYLEILAGCGEVEDRLERFYMTGEWKEFKSDCEGIKNVKQKQICEARFILEEDCEKTYGTEADEKKRKDLIKKCENKKKAKVKKASKGGDCSKYMSKLSKEKKDLISKIKGFISSKVADYDGQVKGDNLTDKEDGFVNGMKIRLTGKMSEEDKKSVMEYNKFIMTAAYKSALSNSIKCNNKNKESAGEEISKVEIDSVSGEEYIRTSDSAFMTPAKSCLQYEESLKATRNAWKAKAVEAIAENSRNIANRLKREEAKQLAADLKVNMEIASMANKVFSACLGEMRSCMTKDNLCGKDYKDCVDENGLRKDKLLPAGIECYAPFKTCMETTSKTLNIKNMSPQLQEIVKGIQQDPDKLSSMAIDSIGDSLGNTFNKLMETECKKAGGFYDNGICGMGVLSATSSSRDKDQWSHTVASWVETTTTTAVTSGTETVTSGRGKNKTTTTRPTSTTKVHSNDVNKSKSEYSQSNEHFEENKRNYGIVLAGTQISCSHKGSNTRSDDYVGAAGNKVNKRSTSINIGANCSIENSATVESGSGVPGDTTDKSSNGDTHITTKVENKITGMSSRAKASASCNTTESIMLISQGASGVTVKSPEESCGFLFAPKGPWDEMSRLCLSPSEKFIFPTEDDKGKGMDALSILKNKLLPPTNYEIYGVYKNPLTKAKRYILRFTHNGILVIRYYRQKPNEEGEYDGNVQPENFTFEQRDGNDKWELLSEHLGLAADICKPKAWIIRNEFQDVVSRWTSQFK